MSNDERTSPYPKVDPWVDLVALEHEVLDFWERTKAFDALREKNRGGEPWSFLDGPITANNPMGVHHAWGRTLKDAYQRYWAMNGRRLRYQNGFDCQGLWVEVEVEKELGFTSKRAVQEFGVDRFVHACKARVVKYSNIQMQQSVRLGMWMDWAHSYYTMSEENNYTIWSFLKKCHERGKIYRGTDVMPWSGRSGSAYSQMEVIEGRKLVAHTALFVRFPLRERENENLLVWTTTPWTLAANVAAAVNVDLDYAKVRTVRDGQVYYLASENLEFQRLERQFKEKKEWIEGVPKLKTIAQFFKERGGYEIVGTVKGADLVGLTYDGPFDELDAQASPGGLPVLNPAVTASAVEAHQVIDGGRDSRGEPTVVAGEGTGIVHIAPGCGDVDHALGKRLGLPAIAPLDEAGCFVHGFGGLTGRNAIEKSTVEWVVDSLTNKGLLVATEEYPHIYPHCWRSKDELVFRVVDEWYINMDWRDEIMRTVDEIRWIPEWGRDRELEWLTNMRDWMISKKRFWGLALPVWVCEACDAFDVVGSREELRERAIEGWEQFEGHSPHKPWIDAVKIACPSCGAKAHRVEDVGNPWLDAGIVPYSTTGYASDREEWAKWVPADLVLECFPGQFRNWFYSLLSMSAMMEGHAPFKTLVGHALVRDEHGKEMHKSEGNAIPFDVAAEQAGADTMRWLYVRQEPTTNLNFGYGPLREIRGGFLNTLWNSFAFLVNYARTEGFDPARERTAFAERPDFDRWILTELQKTIAACRAGIEAFDMRTAARAIEAFVEDLSNWYIRHNRRRFWAPGSEADGRAAFETLYECVEATIRLSAPMVPFVTERMHQTLSVADPSAAPSVHLTAYPAADEGRVDESIAGEMRAVMRLVNLALSTRSAGGMKVRQPLARITISPGDETEQRAAERFREMLGRDLNVKEVEVLAPGAESPLRYALEPSMKTIGPRFGAKGKAVASAIVRDAEALISALRAGRQELEVEVDGERLSLAREDVRLVATSPEGIAAGESGATWVAFDIRLTPELEQEGMMRDLLRHLQEMRKGADLAIEDRIWLRWESSSPRVEALVEAWGEYMATELLCVDVARGEGEGKAKEVKLGADRISLWIGRAT